MAEACRFGSSFTESRALPNHDESFCIFNVFCVFISLVTILADLTTDLTVFAEYCKNGYIYWAITTFLFIVTPIILINIFSLRWIVLDKKFKSRHWITHCCLVGLLDRYIVFLQEALACQNMEPTRNQKILSQRNDLSLLHFLYTFTGTVPQIILQSYAIIILDENYHTKAFALTASIASVVWACATYIYRITSFENENFQWNSVCLKVVWHFGMLIARISGIVLFTIIFGVWTLVPLVSDVEKKLLELEPKLEPRDDHAAAEADDRSAGYLSDDHVGDMGVDADLEPKLEPRDDHAAQADDRSAGDLSDDHNDMGVEADIKSPKKEDIEVKPDAGLSTDAAPQLPSDDDDDLPLSLKAKKRVGKKAKTSKNGKIAKAKKKTAKVAKATAKKAPKLFKKQLEKKDTTERDLDYMAEENLLNIIENSYVVPFKNRRNNYYCYYCKDYYPKPEDLREHTITHDTKPFQLLMGYKKMPKLDITRIDCRLCPEKIDDINTFKTHIEQVHGKKIYSEAPDKLLLYKLTWNNLTCVMCSDVFEDFNGLNTHMVEHFSNYTCDVCGMCFLEKPRLDAHLKRHKDDEKHTCEICGKVFKSNHYKDMHVDIVHKKKAIIRCPRCDECFMSYALKNKHLTDAHGQKRVYPCNLCDKVYNRQKTLTEHQRRNHQKVLRHQCEYCEQRFYLPSRLKEHMATHTGERNFRCEYCEKSYPRLKSLQYHIRTHTNDRRYRCHICGQAFIQNASLKSHIKSHHPECEIEGCYF